MSSRYYESIFDRIAKHNKLTTKLKDKIINMSNEQLDKQFDKYIKDLNSKDNYPTSNSGTNISLFTNNKNCNNVIYTGNYSSNMSRSTNTVNGITYGPSVF
jgi:hypothetical protein